jgi:hypothetical protein
VRIPSVWAVVILCAGACVLPSDMEPATGANGSVAVMRSSLLTTEGERAPLRAHVRETLSRAPDALEIEQRADGLRVVRRGRGFQHATLVTRDARGARQHSCTDDAQTAERALMQGAE